MSLDFEFITALKTRFSGHLLGALLRSESQKYPSVLSQNCLETLRTDLIEVREDSTGCSTWTALSVQPKAENIQGFLICNPQCETIHLVKVDQCFFDNSHSARCDCLIFDARVLCLVELKLNVQSWKRFSDNCREGEQQIEATLAFLRLNFLSCHLNRFRVEAYVVFKNNVYPKNNASLSTRRVAFQAKTQGIPLNLVNYKTF